MTIITFEYTHTFGSLLACVFLFLIIRFFLIFLKSFNTIKKNKKNDHTYSHIHTNGTNDPFVISFRKTRTEMMIISKIEELQKTRDIQFVISFLNYKDNKSVKGSIYIVTSKIVYKIIFIKYNPVLTIYHNLKNFVGFNNNSYKSIYEYLDKNKNCEKQKHHDEFFTWSHYFFTDNYDNESILWTEFIRTQ
jgi:hypothetical protein